ncbi:MAG: hypothetical protein MRERV_15c030 [Mycoplasmataceae bacterium RV_VA103A]|nr:MAG: hypothetical protein MRERV_15c030 [Mycoplasmataceae bacterium RV_VA103A]
MNARIKWFIGNKTYSEIEIGAAVTLTGIAADSEDLRDAGTIILGSELGNLGEGCCKHCPKK